MKKRVPRVPVIMYHSVGPSNPDWVWHHLITPLKIFEDQIMYLKGKGFNSITLQELYNYMTCNSNISENPIVFTFDDGYVDNWVYVFPILRKYVLRFGRKLSAPRFQTLPCLPPRVEAAHMKAQPACLPCPTSAAPRLSPSRRNRAPNRGHGRSPGRFPPGP